jgi:minor histocompatibility antigen H13
LKSKGVFVAYCLIYDKQSAWKDARKNGEFATLSYSKPYFYSALFAYAVGAGLSLVCVHVYRRPQSALLFISPALILSVIAVSFAKGELDQVIDFINFGAVTEPLRPPQPVLRKSPRRRSVSKEKATGARNRSVSKEKPARRGSIKKLAEPEINFDEDDMTSSKDTTIAEDVIANHAAKGTRRTRASTRKE